MDDCVNPLQARAEVQLEKEARVEMELALEQEREDRARATKPTAMPEEVGRSVGWRIERRKSSLSFWGMMLNICPLGDRTKKAVLAVFCSGNYRAP